MATQKWHFKTGQPIPEITPDNYTIKYIKCNSGNFGDCMLHIWCYYGNKKIGIPFNPTNIPDIIYPIPNNSNYGTSNYKLNLIDADSSEFELTLCLNTTTYDFEIGYCRT